MTRKNYGEGCFCLTIVYFTPIKSNRTERKKNSETKSEPSKDDLKSVTFRPHGKAKAVILKWDERELDRTILINYLLSTYGEKAFEELPKLMAQLGMISPGEGLRGVGIEPTATTVSR